VGDHRQEPIGAERKAHGVIVRRRRSAIKRNLRLTPSLLALSLLVVSLTAGARDRAYKDAVLLDGPVIAEDSWVGKGTTTD
jgi:hypothetical protein